MQDTGAAIGALGLGTKLGARILPSGRLEDREAANITLGIHPLMSLLTCKNFMECTQSCTFSPNSRCSLQDPEMVIENVKSNEDHLKRRAELFGDRSELNYVVGYNKYSGQSTICIAGNWLLILKSVSSFFPVVQNLVQLLVPSVCG